MSNREGTETSESQFHLLARRRFLPLFLTQFLGAFNDNLFKSFLGVLLVSAGLAGEFDGDILINLAAGLFILPFVLFSPLAGQMADKWEKAALIRRIKLAEVAIMALAALALWYQSWWALLGILFLMGSQSAFFGPLKFAILPQHLRADELVAGNAQISAGSFVAILTGTLLGTLLAGLDGALRLMAPLLLSVAVLGRLASGWIPEAKGYSEDLRLQPNPFREMAELVRLARARKAVWLAILGISWFWLLGSAYLTQMPAFVATVLGGDVGLIALLLATFTVGIALGSLLCDRLSGHKVEMGIVPLGSLGLSLFGIDLYFSAGNFAGVSGPGLGGYFASDGAIAILVDILMLGVFGGLYVVPLNALVQSRTAIENRARVIACNNILNALFMVAASGLGILLLGPAQLEIPQFLLVLALINAGVAIFIYQQVPEFAMRFMVWLLSHSIYRVCHRGFDNIPERGAAMLVCNHVSYVDALIIGGAIRRPVRFVMYKGIYDLPVLNFIFRTAGTIPICSRNEDEEVYRDAMEGIATALEDGELVCIFPEGKLTRDGEIDVFRRGIETMIEHIPVPVIPMALRGLWGSFFSHRGGVFRNRVRPFSKIDLVVGEPVPPAMVSADHLREKVVTLRGDKR